MRHTLLPIEERKALRKDYFVRLLIVFCFLSSVAFLVGSVSLFPAFINVKNLEQIEKDTGAALRASRETENRASVEAQLKKDALVLNKLQGPISSYRPSEAIRSILNERGPLLFTAFTYSQTGTSTVSVVVQGKAANRTDLLNLKTRLLAAIPRAKVDLPISELARSKDIPFSIKITYPLP